MELTIDGKTFSFDPADPNLPSWTPVLDDNGEVTGFRNDGLGMTFVHVKSPAGPYNQGVFYNRGGSVIVPTVQIEDETYFLVLRQLRPLVSNEPIMEFPRGQGLKDEANYETARREMVEETGLDIPVQSLIHLGNANPDTALIMGANVHAWWLRLPEYFIEFDEFGYPQIRSDIQGNENSRLLENIRMTELVTEEEFTTPSMISSWAFGLVLRKLREEEEAFDSVRIGKRIRRPYELDED